MLRQDKFIVGFLSGIIFPVIFFVIFNEINNWIGVHILQTGHGFTERFVAIISVIANLIPFLIYEKTKKDHALRGIIGATFILAFIIVFYYFRNEIF